MSAPDLDVDQLYADIHAAAAAIHRAASDASDERSLMAAVELSLAELPRETFGLVIADLAAAQWQAQRDGAASK